MRSRKIFLFLFLAVLLSIPVCPLYAIAGYINFDNLTPPGPTPLVLPGATFTPGVDPDVSISGSVIANPQNMSSEPTTPPNMYQVNLDGHGRQLSVPTDYTALTITLDKPVSFVKFNIIMPLFYIDWAIISVMALDNGGNMLDRKKNIVLSSSSNGPLFLSAEDIKAVVIILTVSPGHNFYNVSVGIDNFCFYSMKPAATVIPMF